MIEQIKFRKIPWLELIFITIFLCNLVNLLLIDPIIGLANNADFIRIMTWVNLNYTTDNPEELYFFHILRHFNIGEPVGKADYFSSELIMVATAVNIDTLITKDLIFDITSLGALHAIIYMLGIIILTITLKYYPPIIRVNAYLLIFFIFGDIAYVSYLNSLYLEPASLLFFSLSIGIALLYSQRFESLQHPIITYITFIVTVILFMFAKPQNAIVGIPLAFLSFFLLIRFPNLNKSKNQQQIIAFGLAVFIILISIYQVVYGQPAYLRRNNLFNLVFIDILEHSPSPISDMEELGITNKEYAEVIGYNVYQVDDFANDLVIDFNGKVNYSDLFKFFIRHPSRFLDIIHRCSKSAFLMRPLVLGNFEISIDQKFSQQMSLWSDIKKMVFPGSFSFLLIIFFISLCTIIFKWFKFDKTNQDKAITIVHSTILISSIGQFFTAVIGEGNTDIVKHLFLFNVLIDANFIFMCLYLTWFIYSNLQFIVKSTPITSQ